MTSIRRALPAAAALFCATMIASTPAQQKVPFSMGVPVAPTGLADQPLGEGPFKTELIAAGGLTILLALAADALLVLAQRALTPWARAR